MVWPHALHEAIDEYLEKRLEAEKEILNVFYRAISSGQDSQRIITHPGQQVTLAIEELVQGVADIGCGIAKALCHLLRALSVRATLSCEYIGVIHQFISNESQHFGQPLGRWNRNRNIKWKP